MKKISNTMVFLQKKFIPGFWLFASIVFIAGISYVAFEESTLAAWLKVAFMLLVLIGLNLVIHYTVVKPVPDEVFDSEGSYLLIKNRGQEEKVPLSNIAEASSKHISGKYGGYWKAHLTFNTPIFMGSKINFAVLPAETKNLPDGQPREDHSWVIELKKRMSSK